MDKYSGADMTFAELQAELDIWNRVYWAINRPIWAVETKPDGGRTCKPEDTIPPRLANLPGQDAPGCGNVGQDRQGYQPENNNV
jgi:hypothetical protein